MEPLLERDAAAIRKAIRELAADHEPAELYGAVARFAVLAYSPSQHSIGAILAVAAAADLLEVISDPFALLGECAVYVAQIRRPWSEPPIPDPPPLEADDDASEANLVEAVQGRDRLRAERWLARVLEGDDSRSRFFSAASRDLSDAGQRLTVATAVWTLAERFPAQYRFAALRPAVQMWVAAGPFSNSMTPSTAVDPRTTVRQLAAELSEASGSPLVYQRVILLDAALRLRAMGEDEAAQRALGALQGSEERRIVEFDVTLEDPVYELARDFGCYLHAMAMRTRWSEELDQNAMEAICRAARHNLLDSPSFEQWALA